MKNIKAKLSEVIEYFGENETNLKRKYSDELKSNNAQKDKFEVIYKLIKEFEKKDKLTAEEVKIIQSITCYGSVGFCCGTAKDCIMRDSALHMLKIPKKEFEKEKRAWVLKKLDIGENPHNTPRRVITTARITFKRTGKGERPRKTKEPKTG